MDKRSNKPGGSAYKRMRENKPSQGWWARMILQAPAPMPAEFCGRGGHFVRKV